MKRHLPSNAVVELKGSMYTFISLRLHSGDLEELEAGLADKVRQAPGFFNNAPVVVDFSILERQYLEAVDGDATDAATETSAESSTALADNARASDNSQDSASSTPDRQESAAAVASIDADAITECIRRHKLVPVMASVLDKQSALAQQIPLPLIETSTRETELQVPAKTASTAKPAARADGDGADIVNDKVAGKPDQDATATTNVSSDDTADKTEDTTAAPAVEATEWDAPPPLMVDRPVRSGQQVYARNADLIILGQVGPGAEIVADNNIHVYGPLRGRALCGVKGNADARIFCQSLEAELVSVAGNYRVLEEIPDDVKNRPAQIKLADGKIVIDPL